MTQFLKGLILVLLICFAITPNTIYAQNSLAFNDTLFRDFIAVDNQKTSNAQEFIGTISTANKKLFIPDKELEIKRKLNDTSFIFSFRGQGKPINFEHQFNWVKRANSLWKLSPLLLMQVKNQSLVFPLPLIISIDTSLPDYQNSLKDFKLNSTTAPTIFTASIKNYSTFNNLINNRKVIYMGTLTTHPKEELQINDLDLGVNKINILHAEMPALNGEGITISIKENLPDTTDIDFGARYSYNPLAAVNYSSHASIIATMAAGAGNTYYLGKGVANAATINSSNFTNLLPDASANYKQFNITVQNHSYGVGIENFYGADAAAYDESAHENDSLLFVFSVGNSGNLSASTGKYSGIKNYANATGSFKMAKNILSVGAVDSFGIVGDHSSRGPAFDGRVMPTMVAYGEDGTSGAAALVSGTAAILQQTYKSRHNNQPPSSALIKAILVNSADEVGIKGLNYTSGYGNLNAFKAISTVINNSFFEDSITNNTSKDFQINIPVNIAKAKFTLVWNDAPALPNAYLALVNDLDLELQFPLNNSKWLPWVLNSFANADSLAAVPLRKRDSLNNIEQISISNAVAGNYKLIVKGFNIPAGKQKFYIAYQFDTINSFKFTFPASADNIFPGKTNIIRWQTNFTTTSSKLFYSINKGNSWNAIDTFINLQKEFYYWNAPDTNVLAILKMQIDNTNFFSTPFPISSKINLKVGFNCPDSVLFYWSKLPGISTYKIFNLQDKFLQSLREVTDTFFVFNKTITSSKQFALAPVFNGQSGVKSYTTDYTRQGVDCYVSNFLGDLKADTAANLQLQLGTLFFIQKIIVEKLKNGSYTALDVFNFIDKLQFTAIDSLLQEGVNTYRAHLILKDGRHIFSKTTSIFYFKNSAISIFPNPVHQNDYATIKLKDIDNQFITITNILGQVVYKKQADGNSQNILFNFLKGLYVITITNSNKFIINHFKIIVI